ncbi:ribonuclease [Helicobacter mustelae]|uniref:RNB domain-containing ribonuclease n=1 Tax=Helicobacter mustelae TaxID=217 RepID=UPI000E031A04|nr:ribonuclease R family protein [Helicobacter mustelae]STP13151.1 ribonuclease [Helicobacter mustelae]
MEFFLQILFGCQKIPRIYKNLASHLQARGFLQHKEGCYKIAEGFIIGRVDFKRSLMMLQNLATGEQIPVLGKSPCHKGEIVLARLVCQKLGPRAKILEVLQPCGELLCYLDMHKGRIVGYKLFEDYKRPISLPISQKSLRQLPRHCVISLGLRAKKISQILGVLEDVALDEDLVLLHHNHPKHFSPDAIAYAQSFGKQVDKTLYPDFIDLTHLPFYTIDPASARDHDDAIYYDSRQRVLYVAIADVSAYVTPESVLDTEARQRGFSLYFPHKSYPMLPENLSANICSLKEGEDRLAFVWAIKFDKNSLPKESRLFEAVICNHQNLSYEQVDLLLEKKRHGIKANIARNIKSFFKVALKLQQNRIKKGFCFSSTEVILHLDEENRLASSVWVEESRSHQIIEEAMLLANIEAAKMLQNHGIFRTHQEIKEDRKQMLFFELKQMGYQIRGKNFHEQVRFIQSQALERGQKVEIDKMLIKAQNKAQYKEQKDSHFALGFEAYAHFTSPIRRYGDLFLHRLLKAILRQELPSQNYLLSQSQVICALLNEQEKKIARMEMDFRDRKFMHWAREHIGVVLGAMVVDENYPVLGVIEERIIGARVFLEDCVRVRKFDRIFVKIMAVDLSNAKIYANFQGMQNV